MFRLRGQHLVQQLADRTMCFLDRRAMIGRPRQVGVGKGNSSKRGERHIPEARIPFPAPGSAGKLSREKLLYSLFPAGITSLLSRSFDLPISLGLR
jgi:hypothetical protein